MSFLKNELFPDSNELTHQSAISESINDNIENEENTTKETLIKDSNNIINKVSVDSSILDVENLYSDSVKELDKVKETSIIIEDLDIIISQADKEIENGELSQETANIVVLTHNKLLTNLGMESNITLESALKYKSESYEISRESAIKIIAKVKETLISIIKKVIEELKKAVIKIWAIFDHIEVAAKELANEVSSNYTDLPIEKYKLSIDKASFVGRIAICEKFDLPNLKKFIDFTNKGAPIKELVDLYIKAIKDEDLQVFESLKGIPVAYDLKSNYNLSDAPHKVVPIRVSGKEAIILISEHRMGPSLLVNMDDKYILSKKVIPIKPSNSLQNADLLSRGDIIATANYLFSKSKDQRKAVSDNLKYLDDMKNATNSIKEGSMIGDRVTRLTSILTSCVFDNAYSGIISNRMLLGLLADQAKLYTRQKKVKK